MTHPLPSMSVQPVAVVMDAITLQRMESKLRFHSFQLSALLVFTILTQDFSMIIELINEWQLIFSLIGYHKICNLKA